MSMHSPKLNPICLTVILVSIAAPLCAAETILDFHIAKQSLADALLEFSQTSGIKIFFSSDMAKNIQTNGLNGKYTPQQALQKLLDNSGLQSRYTGSNTITIENSPKQLNKADPTTLKPMTVKGNKDYDPNDPYNTNYNRTHASTATKTDTPIMETPISIQVVPRAVMQDQQAVQVGDAIKNISGVFQGFSLGGFSEQFMIRGFNTQYNNYVDGFIFPVSRISLANAERVEVVKGAAANLYGRIEPGGMINVVTKRPQSTPYYALEQQFGSFDFYRTTADATGALNKDGSLMYRANLEYLNKKSFRDYGFTDRIFFTPSLTWKVSDRTQLDLDFLYSNEDTQEDWGIPASLTTRRPIPIPISRYLGEPSTDKTNTTLTNTALTLAHAFTDDWKVHAKFNYFTRDNLDQQTYQPPAFAGFDEVTGEMPRNFAGYDSLSETYHSTVNLTGKFTTLAVKHQVLAGWESYYSGNNTRDAADAYFWQGAVNNINIYNPQYNPSNIAQIYADPANHSYYDNSGSNSNGVIFQDQITLFDKLHILGGGRYDWATQYNGFSANSAAEAAASQQKLNNERFNPRAGLLYQPWKWLSLYGNYVESLGASTTAIGVDGKILQPEIGEQYEVGFKTAFFDDRLTSNVAFYNLTKLNMAVPIQGTNFSELIGKARSRGAEVDISGKITEGLSLIASYAYTDATILKGTNEGNRLWNVPRNAGSLWVKYDFQQAAVRGLSVGAGAYFQSQKQGDIANDYQLPGYGRIDALVKYKLPVAKAKTTVQFNIENLLDHRYYAASSPFNSNSVVPGAPRTFMGSVKVEF